jgi:uncharacterized protein (DUF2147 family)
MTMHSTTWRGWRTGGGVAVAAMLALTLGVGPGRAAGAPIDGVWLTGQADARIRIGPCGAARCGTIVGLKQPIDPKTGRPLTDTNNPDPARRTRPLVGLTILTGLTPTAGAWKGHVYNSDNGKTYTVTVTPQGRDRLRIQGCLLVFCSGEDWTRTGG